MTTIRSSDLDSGGMYGSVGIFNRLFISFLICRNIILVKKHRSTAFSVGHPNIDNLYFRFSLYFSNIKSVLSKRITVKLKWNYSSYERLYKLVKQF